MPRNRLTANPRSSRHPSRAVPEDIVLGIDLGATKVVSALIAPDGTIVREGGRHVHSNDGPTGVLRSLLDSVEDCWESSPSPVPGAVGIAVAAQVDPASGTVIHAPNLGWRQVPLARNVSQALGGASVTVLNDARAATLAEWRLGAGRGSSNLFCMILGTGVGGSAVVGGRLLEGGAHALGEIGHITVASGGRKCHCPNTGCLEAYVGGWAIAERAQEAARADAKEASHLIERAGSVDAITARTVFESDRAGDRLSGRLVRETERYLADGAVSIANAFNPDTIVLGGGLIAGRPEFASVVESAVRTRCQPPAATARVSIARFGENSPLVGAAVAARESLLSGKPPRPGRGRAATSH